MNFTMTKIAAAAVLALASTSALAVAQDFTNNGAANFTMYDSIGGLTGLFNDVSGFVDYDNMSYGVSSTSPFFGQNWTASGGTLFGPGTYTVNVNGDGSNAGSGTGDVTFTVGAGQMGGNINFAWGPSAGIDVFNVWDITDNGDGTWGYASTDFDGDGILGLKMIDGPFQGFNANFSFVAPAPVPEASTYGMMLAGLGLVGFAVRRRKLVA